MSEDSERDYITPERRAELRTIAQDDVSPGPWGHALLPPSFATVNNVGWEVAWCGHDMPDHSGEDARFIAAFDPPTVLALLDEVDELRHRLDTVLVPFAQRTQERDWARLNDALHHATDGTWSIECGWIVSDIVEAHAVTGTWTPDTAITYGPLLLDGVYEAITGSPASEVMLADCREYFAPFDRQVFAGSAAEAKKAAEAARRELGAHGQRVRSE